MENLAKYVVCPRCKLSGTRGKLAFQCDEAECPQSPKEELAVAKPTETFYDETYQVLVSAARTKMILNQHKGMIHEFEECWLGAVKEMEELRTAIVDGDPERVIEEAGDVLNFMVGIVHNAVAAYRAKEKMATSRTEDEAQGQ